MRDRSQPGEDLGGEADESSKDDEGGAKARIVVLSLFLDRLSDVYSSNSKEAKE